MTDAVYFPIAACGGVSDADAASYDRRWLVVDDKGAWLARTHGDALAGIEVGLRFGYLVVRAPGMLRLDIPLDVIEDDDSVRRKATVAGVEVDVVDEGDLAATWLSTYLGRPCRLAKLDPEGQQVPWPDAR